VRVALVVLIAGALLKGGQNEELRTLLASGAADAWAWIGDLFELLWKQT
jgi:hypothetical protein